MKWIDRLYDENCQAVQELLKTTATFLVDEAEAYTTAPKDDIDEYLDDDATVAEISVERIHMALDALDQFVHAELVKRGHVDKDS